jgi:hypothetical protein
VERRLRKSVVESTRRKASTAPAVLSAAPVKIVKRTRTTARIVMSRKSPKRAKRKSNRAI